jgi:hypothetical protein
MMEAASTSETTVKLLSGYTAQKPIRQPVFTKGKFLTLHSTEMAGMKDPNTVHACLQPTSV